MTSFTIDLLDASNNPIGAGPLQNVLSVSIQEKLDEAGQISFTVPATDDRAATLIDQAARFRVRLSSGDLVYGIIEKDTLDAGSEQPTRTIVGANMLLELQAYSMGWWCFYANSDLNTVILPDLVADTGWTLGTVDAGLGTLYYRFDGSSRLAALITIAANTGKHFRLGSAFRSIDFGAFGASSGVTFQNVASGGPDSDGIPIIKSLQVINDRAPVVNRIIPWGAGQDGGDTNRAKVSLFHLPAADSRWNYVKCKPGVRGAIATVTAMGGDEKVYMTADTAGFHADPVTQMFWCYDPQNLELGRGYNCVIRTIFPGTAIQVRGSPEVPTPPTSFPAYLISDPQLYLEDATAYAEDPHEAVIIFSDVSLTDLSAGAFESAASQLYYRAEQYLATHKVPQTAYAVSVFNCPDTLHVGDLVHVTYSGAVTRGGVTTNWVDVDGDLYVINITRQFNADGSTSATVEVSDMARQPIDSTGALSDVTGLGLTHAVTVGAPSVASATDGSPPGSGSGGDRLTFALPLVRTIDNVTLPIMKDIYSVVDYGATGDGTTDDTTAVQAAYDAAFAAAAGGILFFPAGTYSLTHLDLHQATTDYNKHVRIVGVNPQASVLKFNTTGVAIDCIGALRIQFENLWITSGSSAPSVGVLLARSITATDAHDFSFLNVWIWGNFTQACVASICSELNVWTNCKFYNSNTSGGVCFFTSDYATGYKLNSSAAYATFTVSSTHGTIYHSANTANTFYGCHFTATGTANLCLSMESAAQNSFFGCTFQAVNNSPAATSLVLISAEAAYPFNTPVLFSGCLFEAGGTTHGIEFYSPTTARSFYNISIVGCEFNLYDTGQESIICTGSYSGISGLINFTYTGNGRPATNPDSIRIDYAQNSEIRVDGTFRIFTGLSNCRILAADYDFLQSAELLTWDRVERRFNALTKPTSGIYFLGEIVWNENTTDGVEIGWVASGYDGGTYEAFRANSTAYDIGTWLCLPGISTWEVTAGSGLTGSNPPSETGDIGDTVADGGYTLTKRSNHTCFFNPFGWIGQATLGDSATFVQNSGNAINDASTFDNYTLAQIVRALRDIGLLA